MVALLDEANQELRFNRQILSTTLENISQGVSVVDAEMRLVAWNRRYQELFDYPDGMLYVGRPVSDLIRWNAERGEMGSGPALEPRRGTGAPPPRPPARRRAARVRARARQRPGHRDARPAAARRRLRHQLQRRHRLQARRAGPARGQRNAGAARRTAHARSRGRAAVEDALPRRDQP